jgi:hypothetical protein
MIPTTVRTGVTPTAAANPGIPGTGAGIVAPGQAVRRLVALCPTFAASWSSVVLDPANWADDRHLDAGETAESVVRHLAVMSLAGFHDIVAAVIGHFRHGHRGNGNTLRRALVEMVQHYLTTPSLVALSA